MSLVPSAVEPPPVAERLRARAGNRAQWLIVGCYLLAAIAVTWRLWADPAARAQAGDPADVDLFAWFMRYDATAVAHGHLPALVTTAMNAPRGINLMWNTSFLLPGVLLSPGDAAGRPAGQPHDRADAGLRRLGGQPVLGAAPVGGQPGAAALGGAVYGFSPALVNSGIGHYHLQFAVLPPLIIDALLRIVTGRGSAVRSGAWLGLLAAAQLFTGEELLADTALAAWCWWWCSPPVTRGRCATGPGTSRRDREAVAVVLLICGHALWVQFAGPLTQHNNPAGPEPFTNRLAFFVDPAGNLLFHTPATAAAAAAYSRGLPEYLGYLGWPLLVVLVAATIRYWRDPKVRTMAVTVAVLELFSPRRRNPEPRRVPVPGVPAAVPLAAGLAGVQPGAAGPAVHPRGRRGGRRARVLARPGAPGGPGPAGPGAGPSRPRSRCWRCCRWSRCRTRPRRSRRRRPAGRRPSPGCGSRRAPACSSSRSRCSATPR